MPTLAYFGINSSGLNLAIDVLVLFVVVLYFSLIFWTYKDARRRVADPMLVMCAVVASLFPYVGTIIYIILRPPEYLEDVRERELETHAAEVRLAQLEQSMCPHCDHHIERDFLRCPSCLRKLKEPCQSCGKPLERTWSLCPYCEADVPGAKAPRRSTRRRERMEASIESEAQTGESKALKDDGASASASASAGAGAGAGARTPVPAAKPEPTSGAGTARAPRASRPRPSSSS
jgi:hypothetical protein